MLPEPHVDADGMEYWSQAERERLVLRHCGACRRPHFPPRCLCPNCWSADLDWVPASGLGTVYAFTIMHRAPAAAFRERAPYVVALIDLAEGPRMMANIIGEDALNVRLGEPVRVVFEQRGARKVPQFERDVVPTA